MSTKDDDTFLLFIENNLPEHKKHWEVIANLPRISKILSPRKFFIWQAVGELASRSFTGSYFKKTMLYPDANAHSDMHYDFRINDEELFLTYAEYVTKYPECAFDVYLFKLQSQYANFAFGYNIKNKPELFWNKKRDLVLSSGIEMENFRELKSMNNYRKRVEEYIKVPYTGGFVIDNNSLMYGSIKFEFEQIRYIPAFMAELSKHFLEWAFEYENYKKNFDYPKIRDSLRFDFEQIENTVAGYRYECEQKLKSLFFNNPKYAFIEIEKNEYRRSSDNEIKIKYKPKKSMLKITIEKTLDTKNFEEEYKKLQKEVL